MLKKQIGLVIGLCLAALLPGPASAASSDIVPSLISAREIEKLVEPIALYPDILLQVILPASTYPDQIVDAGLLIRGPQDAAKVKDQNWDASVKSVANYPGVLKMMYTDLQWTTDLGQAFLHQNRELLDAVQRLRGKASALGNLKTDEGQKVSEQKAPDGNTYITIESSNPEVVYVPQSTTTVYEEHTTTSSALVPLATFGIGMAIGAAMNDDDDHNHYYYGGGGGMWYGGNNADHWLDNRRAAWEDYNNRMSDRQNYNQDARTDRREFRQDQVEKGNWNKPTAEQRQAAQQKANERRASMDSQRAAAKSNYNARAEQARSNYGSSSARAQQARSNYGGGAFSGYGSGSATARASSRGSYSRGSYGGGGGARRGGGGRRR